MLMMDIDDFKAINDRHGHAAGDAALRHVVQIARSRVRSTDVCAPLGGDELAVLLAETTLRDARNLAGTVQASVASQPLLLDGMAVPLTLSIGLAAHSMDPRSCCAPPTPRCTWPSARARTGSRPSTPRGRTTGG